MFIAASLLIGLIVGILMAQRARWEFFVVLLASVFVWGVVEYNLFTLAKRIEKIESGQVVEVKN